MIFGIDGIDQKTALHRKNQKFDESWYAMTYCKQNLNQKQSWSHGSLYLPNTINMKSNKPQTVGKATQNKIPDCKKR